MSNALRRVPFVPWTPDSGESESSILEVDGLIPVGFRSTPYHGINEVAYASIPSPTSFTTARIANAPLATIGFTDSTGEVVNIVGTAKDLFFLSKDNTWIKVNHFADASDQYTGVDRWEFARFGDNIIAVTQEYPPLILKSGSDPYKFVPLDGNPPQARHIGVVSDFVILGGIKDRPEVIAWSGFNNPEIWGEDSRTQTSEQNLLGGGGDVVSIVPGDIGLVFQDNAIRRLEYQGPPPIFAIRNILPGMGTLAPKSICWQGKHVFFYGLNGFYRMHLHSNELQQIGVGRVDNWFRNDADTNTFANMTGTVDFRRQLVWWLYPSKGHRIGFNRALIYNFGLDLWSQIDFTTIGAIGNIVSVGVANPRPVSLDQLDDSPFFYGDPNDDPAPKNPPPPSAGTGQSNFGMDSPAPALDSAAYDGGRDFVIFTAAGSFNDDSEPLHEANILTGAPLAGSITSPLLRDGSGGSSFLSRIRVVSDKAIIDTITIMYRDSEWDRTFEEEVVTIETASGEANTFIDTRILAIKIDFRWTNNVSAIYVDLQPSGMRP